MLQALQDIENLPGAMPPTTLTDSDGHTVPNIRWSTQFAQIAGGKYVAGAEPFSTSPSSRRRLPNVYVEFGTTMASMIVTFPTVWSHLIGQLLYYMGEDNIVFGSDSMWYGGPQWQIEALWRSQIPDDIADRWNYPQLTKAAKRKILGMNSARLYGLSPAASKYKQGNLASYTTAPELQPGGSMDTVLQGLGYPASITPASLMPDDNFSRAKRWAGTSAAAAATRASAGCGRNEGHAAGAVKRPDGPARRQPPGFPGGCFRLTRRRSKTSIWRGRPLIVDSRRRPWQAAN